MDADDLLRQAVYEAVQETMADPRINPESEVKRLVSMVESMYWICLQEQEQEDEYHASLAVDTESDTPYGTA